MNTIGERIAGLRKDRAMTQEEFASVIGVSPQSVSKWENSITMPDIMLLPVIAGIFEITVDELFCEKRESVAKTFPMAELPMAAYMSVLENMQRAWHWGDKSAKISEAEIIGNAIETQKSLAEYPESHTGIVTSKYGAVYANSEISLCYLKNKEESLYMLDDEKIAGFLTALADAAFRKILKYQLENPERSFTVSSVCQKCDIDEAAAKNALDRLVDCSLMSCQTVDTGSDEPLKVYHLWGEHKMNLIVYPLLNLAQRMCDFREHWRGFSG